MSVNGARSEWRWIDWLQRREAAGRKGDRHRFPVGIGDDAAVWTPGRGQSVVLTVDTQVEDIHFRRAWLPLGAIGERAVSAAASDLAAMVARPVAILASLTLDASIGTREFRALQGGILRAARRHGLRLLGGNLSGGPLSIAITAIGEGRARDLRCRSGAREGDDLWVTGSPGLARLGLLALERGHRASPGLSPPLRPALRSFLKPRPRIDEALALLRTLRPNAVTDLSDGLSCDLGHILADSSRALGVPLGAHLDAAALAGLPHLHRAAQSLGVEAVATALRGGEDYELLLAAPPRRHPGRVAAAFERRFGLRLTRIGRLVRGHGLRLATDGGRMQAIASEGWEHFGAPGGGRGR